ncbi:nickel pincer cofactor biosynthesis protein LarB [Lichenifustis flavocetrariae]|uniref:Nickel pincer cofactor biosynthesis protein LarB n=1 Tax=Lichenifustis flavocetrariae TaxID=2949735 RepID=A0AA42CPX9_9HYPH|nr:nickel pincer cofactor biosynthesis protein LarB [Lichenifustis flavocetrariae]MCW6510877.1 nickel pincer cofactor biosynthesis protein LarB [Lichenifustis flavocetrariae]
MADYNFDFERRSRIGLDEAVFCAGKSAEQVAAIVAGVRQGVTGLLLTRLDPDKFAALPPEQRNALDYDPMSRTAILGRPRSQEPGPAVAIVMAGTSDVPMGREAARTLGFNGQAHQTFTDVGVAGLWRLLDRIEEIRQAPVVIVAAGMDAALISVVGGLVSSAVIGLPTSVGYGVAAGGTTALHAGLASCAPGVPIMNIDNGYGAACAALRIMNMLRASERPAAKTGGDHHQSERTDLAS